MNRIARNRFRRGTAMTEFIICILPYTLAFMGGVFLWHIALGKQELYKYAFSASHGGGTDGEAFFQGMSGQATLAEVQQYDQASHAEYNTLTNADAEEPVLPYDEDGQDIEKGITLSALRASVGADLQVRVRLTGQGRILNKLGLLADIPTGTYDLADEINLEMEVDPNVCEDMGRAMGAWMEYSRGGGEGTTYAYAPRPAGSGSEGVDPNRLGPGEWSPKTTYDDSGKKQDWLEDGVQIGGTEEFAAYASRVNEEEAAQRGDHTGGMNSAGMSYLPQVLQQQSGEMVTIEAVAPLSMSAPVLAPSGTGAESDWAKNHPYPQE